MTCAGLVPYPLPVVPGAKMFTDSCWQSLYNYRANAGSFADQSPKYISGLGPEGILVRFVPAQEVKVLAALFDGLVYSVGKQRDARAVRSEPGVVARVVKIDAVPVVE